MGSIELVLVMLLAVIVSSFVVRALPFPVPLPIVQIALGGLIAGVFDHGVVLEPAVFFLLFLPPLLFLDGWRIPKDGLFRDRLPILQLALGLVVFTVVGAGFFIHWLIPTMPLAVAFALAAIVSPTDPVAVSSIASRVPMPKRLVHILEGESLLNDASGLVCFRFAVAAAVTGSFSLTSATLTFLWVASAGVAVGVGLTLAITSVQHRLSRRFGRDDGSPILINLLVPFGVYLLAERLHASGILAAVAAGITMSYVELTGRSMPTTRIQRSAVWNTIQLALNGIMFVLLGEQLPGILRAAIASVQESGHRDPWWLAVYALAVTAGLFVLRLAWVWVSLWLSHFKRRPAGGHFGNRSWRMILVSSLAGVRGAITLAGILSLPLLLPDGGAFPARNLAIFLAASVIILSLLAASIALPLLLRGLQVPGEPVADQEEDLARTVAARAAIDAVNQAQQEMAAKADPEDAELCASAAGRVLAFYQYRAQQDVAEVSTAARLRKADAAERALRLAALRAERKTIVDLARHRKISDEVSTKLIREFDLLEARYR